MRYVAPGSDDKLVNIHLENPVNGYLFRVVTTVGDICLRWLAGFLVDNLLEALSRSVYKSVALKN
jgi:hypothetical protein